MNTRSLFPATRCPRVLQRIPFGALIDRRARRLAVCGVCSLIAFCIALFVVCSTASSQDTLASDKSSSFSVTITPATTTITVCELLLVAVEFRNESRESIPVGNDYRKRLRFHIRPVGGSFEAADYRHKPRGRDFMDMDLFTLPPDTSKIWDEVLLTTRTESATGPGFLFERPGKYEIKATMIWYERRGPPHPSWQASNSFLLTVRPARPQDEAARSIITQPDVARVLGNDEVDFSNEVRQKLKALSDNHADSPYADFVNYQLGRHFRAHREAVRPPMTNQPDAVSTFDKTRQTLGRQASEYFWRISHRMPALRSRAAHLQLRVCASRESASERFDFSQFKRDLRFRTPLPSYFSRYLFLTPDRVEKSIGTMELDHTEDDRLDQEVVFTRSEKTTFGQMVDEASEQSGVPLDAAPEARARRVRLGEPARFVLRKWMLSQQSYERVWKKRGNGYYLPYVPPRVWVRKEGPNGIEYRLVPQPQQSSQPGGANPERPDN